MSTARIRVVLLIALAIVATTTAAWAALAPVDAESREQLYVIPKGTYARRMAGEPLDILPPVLRLTLGVKDILVLRNDDDVPQLFGPVLIMPGQNFKLPFQRASTYQFACSLHVNGKLDVIVAPTPEAGWQRLRWRVASIGNGLSGL